MKIKKIKIKNFRGYREEIGIEFDDLNVFIGKNDIGKSTILEALDIFFDKDAVVKIEKNDLNKQAEENEETDIEISVVLSGFPKEINIDAGNLTTLRNEFLLNEEGFLEIKKIYRNGKLTNVFIIANHPTNNLAKDLLLKKRQELKKIVEDNNFECSNKNLNAELRKAIYENCGDLNLTITAIPANKEDAKAIWENLQKYMPVYALFQSDRSNSDQDNEVQDPMKLAVKEILKNEDLQEKFKEIATEVENKTKEIAGSTLEKLKEMNPEIANELKPEIPSFDKLKWEDVFKKISISSDDGIPLNKRGSGVKRLVLLNFFRAEADRRKRERNIADVIYAIEEPETSQHPDHQKLLIKSFIELSKSNNTQILLTTHSPAIAQLIPTKNLRLIKKNRSSELEIVSTQENENVILEVAETLGVLPTLSKVVICVEGENDRNFLININQNIPELKEIIDLKQKNISIIPMQGSNLQNWIDRNYLENSNVIEFHIYDNDREDYKNKILEINEANDGRRFGKITDKLEIENYIHPSLIENEFNNISCNSIQDWDQEDISNFIANKVGKNEKVIKQILNGKLSQQMTKELFENLNAWDEVKGWFEEIKRLFNLTITDNNT